MPLIHDKTITIGESQLDSFGHLNNARYLELFEQARWDVITERGFGIDTIRRTKTGPVVLEVTLKFTGELFPRDLVVIRSKLLAYERKVAKMSQQMLKGGTDLVCEAIFTFGLFDIEKRRLIEPTPEWAHAVGLDAAP